MDEKNKLYLTDDETVLYGTKQQIEKLDNFIDMYYHLQKSGQTISTLTSSWN